MPTIETYTSHYLLVPTANPNEYTILAELPGPNTLSDTLDGTPDGFTAVNDEFANSGATPPDATLLGFYTNGDPVFVNTGFTQVRLYSNTSGLTGTFTLNTSGTYAYCFGEGTRIAGHSGEKRVENLQIGDVVRTADGSRVRVKWIGRQTVHKLFSGPNMQPVRIRAGALGGGVPHSDLTVTADHGMVIDGLVINASALINGTTIDWVPMTELPDRVTYFHVETEAHDVILANGAPAETFVDIPGRMAFDNYQEYLDLYGAERIIPEMDRPRISAQRLVPDHIKARLGIVEPEVDWDAPLTA